MLFPTLGILFCSEPIISVKDTTFVGSDDPAYPFPLPLISNIYTTLQYKLWIQSPNEYEWCCYVGMFSNLLHLNLCCNFSPSIVDTRWPLKIYGWVMIHSQGIHTISYIRNKFLNIFHVWPISTWYFEVGFRGGVLRPTLFFVFYFYIFNLGQTYKVDWKYGYTDRQQGSPCWTGRVYDVVLIIVNTVYLRYLLSLWCKIIDRFLLL